jgi:hypothetical protein
VRKVRHDDGHTVRIFHEETPPYWRGFFCDYRRRFEVFFFFADFLAFVRRATFFFFAIESV